MSNKNSMSDKARRIMNGVALINLCQRSKDDFDMVRAIRLIEEGADLSVKGDNNNTPLLHMAIRKHHFKFALKLIQHGAPIEDTDERGYTPLHIATMIPNLKIVKALCQAGANIYAIGHNNHSAYSLAISLSIFSEDKSEEYKKVEKFLTVEIEKRRQDKVDRMINKTTVSSRDIERKKATFKKKNNNKKNKRGPKP